jgi:hypothetical protein
MPIHDWTRVIPGGFHSFHQNCTIEIFRTLNQGLLPPGYSAYTDLRVSGWEPDIVSIQSKPSGPPQKAIATTPPRAQQVVRLEADAAFYARKANRVAIRHEFGQVVAIIEVVSPGNKDSAHAIRSFVSQAVEFLSSGVNLLVIDLFPPTPRDPEGIHQLVWKELTDEPIESRPREKPLTVVSYHPGRDLTAYVDQLAVGDPLPEAPLFLAPECHINLPLEETYHTSWSSTPQPIREIVGGGPAGDVL